MANFYKIKYTGKQLAELLDQIYDIPYSSGDGIILAETQIQANVTTMLYADGLYYWYINGDRTDIVNPDGEGATVPTATIGENGFWYLNGQQTNLLVPSGRSISIDPNYAKFTNYLTTEKVNEQLEPILTDIANLKVTKQDSLIAGDRITIQNNTISTSVDIPTQISDLPNDAGYVNLNEVKDYVDPIDETLRSDIASHGIRLSTLESANYVYDGDETQFIQDLYSGTKLNNGNYISNNNYVSVLTRNPEVTTEFVKNNYYLTAGQHNIIYSNGDVLATFNIGISGYYNIFFRPDGNDAWGGDKYYVAQVQNTATTNLARSVLSNEYFIRGTMNNWGEDGSNDTLPMYDNGSEAIYWGVYLTAGTEFKIFNKTDSDWYPESNYIINNNKFVDITFNKTSHNISVADSAFSPYYIDKVSTGFRAIVHLGNAIVFNKDGITKYSVDVGGNRIVKTLQNVAFSADYSDLINTPNVYTQEQVDQFVNELETSLSDHTNNKNNPHAVTKAQVGLGNVDNTSDLNKPISTATQEALTNLENAIQTKVDKVDGKGLSTNDFTTVYKTQLDNLSTTYATKQDLTDIINGAPEEYDTLKEIAEWIKSDESGSAAMTSDIATLKSYFTDGSANKALADQSGNEIETTYAKISDLNSLSAEVETKQENLVSGTNIKTVNGNSLLGSGDLDVSDNVTINLGTLSSSGGTLGAEILSQITSNLGNKNITFKANIDLGDGYLNMASQSYQFVSGNFLAISMTMLADVVYDPVSVIAAIISLQDGSYNTSTISLPREFKTINNESIAGSGNIDTTSKMVNLGTLTAEGTLDAGKFQELMTLFQNEEIIQVYFEYKSTAYITASAGSIQGAMFIIAYSLSELGSVECAFLGISQDGSYGLYIIPLPSSLKTINNNSLIGNGNISVQPTLVSGTNIKTVDGQSILGEGNIEIDGSKFQIIDVTKDTLNNSISMIYSSISSSVDASFSNQSTIYNNIATAVNNGLVPILKFTDGYGYYKEYFPLNSGEYVFILNHTTTSQSINNPINYIITLKVGNTQNNGGCGNLSQIPSTVVISSGAFGDSGSLSYAETQYLTKALNNAQGNSSAGIFILNNTDNNIYYVINMQTSPSPSLIAYTITQGSVELLNLTISGITTYYSKTTYPLGGGGESNNITIDLGTLEVEGGTLSPTILSEINNAISENKNISIKAVLDGAITFPNVTYGGDNLYCTGFLYIGNELNSVILNITLTTGQYVAGIVNMQEKLVSGTNIKTINGQTLLGQGNIEIDGSDSITIDLGELSLGSDGITPSEILEQINNNLGSKNITFVGTIAGTSFTTATYFYVSANMFIISALVSNTVYNLTINLTTGSSTLSQAMLLDSVDVKTINNNSLVGAGNISVQETLVSGTNIKTVNGNSLLGSGNLEINVPLVISKIISGTSVLSTDSEHNVAIFSIGLFNRPPVIGDTLIFYYKNTIYDTLDCLYAEVTDVTETNVTILIKDMFNCKLSLPLPSLPDDASTKTYVLKAVNGVMTWVEETA